MSEGIHKVRTLRSLSLHDPSAVLPRRAHQILARLRCAERGVRRQRHVGKFRQRMIRRQRLDVEDVEAGMADLA